MNFYLISLCLLVIFAPVCLAQCDPAAPWNPNPPVLSGVSSWFNAQAQGGSSQFTGACSWPKSNTDVNVAAYTASTADAECTLCGNCYSVTGPVGSVVVRVIDYCDTSAGACGLNVTPQWTLNEQPYITIAGSTNTGSVPVTWFGPVACPMYSPSTDLAYAGLSGSNVWYVNIRVSQQRYPLSTVEFSNPNVAGNPYTNISRYPGNQWYYNPSAQQAWPFNIRTTDVLGNQVVDTIELAVMSANKTGTGGNFPDPSPSNTPTNSLTPSNTPSLSITSSISTTRTASISSSRTATPTPTRTGSISASATRTTNLTPSNTPTNSLTPSNTPTHSLTPSNTRTPSVTSSISITGTNSKTSTATRSSSPSPSK